MGTSARSSGRRLQGGLSPPTPLRAQSVPFSRSRTRRRRQGLRATCEAGHWQGGTASRPTDHLTAGSCPEGAEHADGLAGCDQHAALAPLPPPRPPGRPSLCPAASDTASCDSCMSAGRACACTQIKRADRLLLHTARLPPHWRGVCVCAAALHGSALRELALIK